jgi:putative transposase
VALLNFLAGRAKYPAFKKKHSHQSIRLYMAKSKEPLDMKRTREHSSEPSSITISKDCAGRHFVSMRCEFEPVKLPVSPKTVGVELGLNHLFITSDGFKQKNPRHTKQYQVKLTYLQQRISKTKKGSSNRNKARQKVARLPAKIADSRLNALHKASRTLINEKQVVCVENLAVKNMIKNPCLAKHIADASWGEFVRQLDYKVEWAGRKLVKIDRWLPSSKCCSCCGYSMKRLPLDVRWWDCPECNTRHDRDINAAINIKTVGLAG